MRRGCMSVHPCLILRIVWYVIVQGREGPVEAESIIRLERGGEKMMGQVYALDLSHCEEEKKAMLLIGRGWRRPKGCRGAVCFIQQIVAKRRDETEYAAGVP